MEDTAWGYKVVSMRLFRYYSMSACLLTKITDSNRFVEYKIGAWTFPSVGYGPLSYIKDVDDIEPLIHRVFGLWLGDGYTLFVFRCQSLPHEGPRYLWAKSGSYSPESYDIPCEYSGGIKLVGSSLCLVTNESLRYLKYEDMSCTNYDKKGI